MDRLRGLLREELAAYGGGEAFLKWLRTDPEPLRRWSDRDISLPEHTEE